MARVAKPTGKEYHGGGTTGDGDPCPITPEHGKMLVRGDTQYCPHQSHDGDWASGEHRGPTRAFWPLGNRARAEAFAAWKETHA
jgi:hypothetical protein